MDVAQEVSRGLPRDAVGPARTIAFGTSIVAPSASAVTVLVLVLAYAGFASPLVVLITFAGRLPSAGWAYTYNSRGLGPAAGFRRCPRARGR
jgi:amino acid transporter